MKDGQVVRIDIDSDGDDEFGPGKIYQMRSCVRGRTNRQRIYSPDRIQKPLKRVEGTKRGEGKYEEDVYKRQVPGCRGSSCTRRLERSQTATSATTPSARSGSRRA